MAEDCTPLAPSGGCDIAGLHLQSTGKRLPKDTGGGHEFVTELPETGDDGVEYVLMDDISDCSTYRGTYVYDKDCEGWIQTSGSGGGGTIERYSFEQTSTGWRAKRNNTVIFTYVDKDTIDSYEDTADGFQIIRNGVVIFTHTDGGGGDCKEYTITATADGWVFKEDGVTKFTYTEPANDPSDGTYFTSGTLTTAITGTTTVAASSVTGLTLADVVIGETLIYDEAGSVGRVTAVNGTNLTVETITTAPGERRGTRLGAVDDYTDLPATCAAATALGWQTPLAGDFAYVREDTSHDSHLTEWVISSIDSSCNITWGYSHTLNAGNYVLDIYKNGDYPSGNPIPKNPDGSVTLPKDENTKYDFENVMDGSDIIGWRVKDHDSGTVLYTYTDKDEDTTYTFSDVVAGGKVVGWKVVDSNGTTVYTYTDLNDESDGAYLTSETLSTTIADTTSVPVSSVSGFAIADVVDGETLIYDGVGTVGVVTAHTSTTLTVTTMTVSGSGDASSFVYNTSVALSTTVGSQTTAALSTLSNTAGTTPVAGDIIIGKTLVYDDYGVIGVVDGISGSNVSITTITSSGSPAGGGYSLGWADGVLSSTWTASVGAIPFVNKTGSTFTQPANGKWEIPAHTTVLVALSIGLTGTAKPNGEWGVREEGSSSFICRVDPYDGTGTESWALNDTATGIYVNDTNLPKTIVAECTAVQTPGAQIYAATSHITVTEIGRALSSESDLAAVGGTFSAGTVTNQWEKLTLTPTQGNTGTVTNGVFYAPNTGWYQLYADTGWTDAKNMWFSWQKRADVIPSNTVTNVNTYNLASNTGTGTNDTTQQGTCRENIHATVYLKAGEPITLQLYCTQKMTANYKLQWAIVQLSAPTKVYGGINLIAADDVYTETEQLVGSYLGKPLYKKTKVIPSASYANGSENLFTMGLSNVETVVKIEGTTFRAGYFCSITEPHASTHMVNTYYTPADDKLRVHFVLGYANCTIRATIYYTKTTDAANSAPNKNSLLLTRPDLWTAGVEYDFGGGLYGKRLKGTAAFAADSTGRVTWNTNICTSVATTAKIINKGGMVDMSKTSGTNWYDINGSWNNGNNTLTQSVAAYFLATNTSNNLKFYGVVNGGAGNYQYDIWFTYIKA